MKNLDVLLNKLPKQKGIMGREDYFNSAVLVLFVFIDKEYHLLFQKRAAGIRQGSEICFPGGAFDEDKDTSFKDTAIRETCEELGIKESDFKVTGFLDTHVAPMGAIIEPYIGLMNEQVLEKMEIDKNEVESIFTLPLSFFLENDAEIYKARLELQAIHKDKDGNEQILLPGKKLGLPEKYHKTWGGKKHKVYVYQTEFGVIWGLTAVIIQDLVAKLK